MRVLGVDPAVAGATGYGIVEFEGMRPQLLRFGALKLPLRATFAARLREIHQLIAQLVDEFAPDAVAVESVFAALNVKTALRLAEMRGVVLLAAAIWLLGESLTDLNARTGGEALPNGREMAPTNIAIRPSQDVDGTINQQ